jgi:hypothetical protein
MPSFKTVAAALLAALLCLRRRAEAWRLGFGGQ